MTLLGVPEFNIGTSSTTASAAASGGGMDMSLDDMIASRRKSTRTKPAAAARKPAARKPTGADKAAGRQRATRAAKVNARRGIAQNSQGKPSPMDIEREVYRQTRRNSTPKKKNAPRSRQDTNAQVKARKQLLSEKQKKAQKKQQQQAGSSVPTWVTGTKRPPSKKAVNAAVTAMTENGFKVPPGMQMVISFAPAPQQAPTTTTSNTNQKKNTNNNKNNNNKGKQTKGGRGGGRKK